jgi:DNA-binding NarL/FixJ family response regulator
VVERLHGDDRHRRRPRDARPALTGDMSPDTLMKAEAAGFKAFLRKPADMDRVEMVLRPLLQGN